MNYFETVSELINKAEDYVRMRFLREYTLYKDATRLLGTDDRKKIMVYRGLRDGYCIIGIGYLTDSKIDDDHWFYPPIRDFLNLGISGSYKVTHRSDRKIRLKQIK